MKGSIPHEVTEQSLSTFRELISKVNQIVHLCARLSSLRTKDFALKHEIEQSVNNPKFYF